MSDNAPTLVSSQDALKRAAALKALSFIDDGMTVGLGTGSTANFFIDGLGERVQDGLSIRSVATSIASAQRAQALNIPVFDLDEVEDIDVTVDGADEVDPDLRLVKGGGGALLREKIVASASAEMIVVVDGSKRVEMLGAFPLPVEIVPFGYAKTCEHIQSMLESAECGGTEVVMRARDGELFVTDGGHYIADCQTKSIPDADTLAILLSQIPGVVDHGLFIGMCKRLIVGSVSGPQIIEAEF